MKVGIFGGSFNPPHIGHYRAALEVAEALDLEKVIMLVSARPPHKGSGDGADHMLDGADRLRLARAGIGDCPRLEASDLELSRPGYSYTIDSMRYFQSLYGEDVPFILGVDALKYIYLWKDAAEFVKKVDLVVVTRDGVDSSVALDAFGRLGLFDGADSRALIEELTRSGAARLSAIEGARSTIRALKIARLDISSAAIRRRIVQGESVSYLLPESVERILSREGFYRVDRGLDRF